MAETQKAGKQQVEEKSREGKRQTEEKPKAGRAKRTTGRILARRATAEYRTAGQEQASRVREEINNALADARRIREEIEARIDTQWHNRPAPKTAGAKGGGRRRRAKA